MFSTIIEQYSEATVGGGTTYRRTGSVQLGDARVNHFQLVPNFNWNGTVGTLQRRSALPVLSSGGAEKEE